jgi:hypothetical protein
MWFSVFPRKWNLSLISIFISVNLTGGQRGDGGGGGVRSALFFLLKSTRARCAAKTPLVLNTSCYFHGVLFDVL